MFVYQPTLSMLQLKKDKDIDYVISCRSKGVYNSTISEQDTAFLRNIKLFGYKWKLNLISTLVWCD